MTATAILHTLDAAKPFSRLRRALPAVLLPILGLGMLACLDALQTEYRLPEHTLFMIAGTSAEISGTLHGQHSKLPPRIQLSLSPDSTTVTLSRVTVANKIFTSDTLWHTHPRHSRPNNVHSKRQLSRSAPRGSAIVANQYLLEY